MVDSRYFIGITFHAKSGQAYKVNSFRRRYDPRFGQNAHLHMGIVPSFEIGSKNLEGLISDLQDDLDSYFCAEPTLDIVFTNFDVFLGGKSNFLYLKGRCPIDLIHAQEGCVELCQKYGNIVKEGGKQEVDFRPIMPIGRFVASHQLHFAIETLKREFEFPFSLKATGISLFEKHPIIGWVVKRELHSFEAGTQDQFSESVLIEA